MYGKVAASFKHAFCRISADRARPGSSGIDAIHDTANVKLGVLFSERCIDACNKGPLAVRPEPERMSFLVNHSVRETETLHRLRRW